MTKIRNRAYYNPLTEEERNTARDNALQSLPAEQRATIEELADEIVAHVKTRAPEIAFSRKSALELIAQVGIDEKFGRLTRMIRNGAILQ